MVEWMREAGLPEPEYKEEMGGFSVYFYRDIYTEENMRKMGLNERQIKAVMYTKEKGRITNKEYRKICSTSERTATRDLADLVSQEIFEQIGITGKGTSYTLKTPQSRQTRHEDATKTQGDPSTEAKMNEMSEPYKLPDGWRWVKLGDVCEINPKRSKDFKRSPDSPTTFVPMEAVNENTGSITASKVVPYSKVSKGYTYFEEDDVLFAKITPCMQNGKHVIARNLIDKIGFGTTEFHVLRASDKILPEWIWYFIRQPSFLKEATAYFTGAVGQQRIPVYFLSNYTIPLPPVETQHRIASKFRISCRRWSVPGLPAKSSLRRQKRFHQRICVRSLRARRQRSGREKGWEIFLVFNRGLPCRRKGGRVFPPILFCVL